MFNRIELFKSSLATLVLALLIVSLTGCGTLSVTTTPDDASVVITSPGVSAKKILGKTPYKAAMSDLEEIGKIGSLLLTVEKPGFEPMHIYVPTSARSSISVDAILKPREPSNFADINKLIKLTLRAEKEIMQKEYDAAFKTAAEIKNINENIAAAHEIEGAVYFLKGNLEKARYAWLRSLDLDSNNPDTARMLQELNSKSGREPR